MTLYTSVMFDRSSAMANCWSCCIVLCAVMSLMDAKPVELLDGAVSLPAKPVELVSLLDPPTTVSKEELQGRGDFWTRWNSDGDDMQDASGTLETGIFTSEDESSFVSKLRGGEIVDLSAGCGRGKNRLATLADGTRFCCRYRDLQWRDIRGELYAYHLNNFLGMRNAPPATLIKINFSSPQWRKVAPAAREAGWSNRMTIIATLFVDDLAPETFPPVLTKDDSRMVTAEYLDEAPQEDRSRILQWSDLIVFDFLVGHSDRIFNSLFNLQWNERMLERPVHNLLKTKQGDKLLLFDNESGFWLGYKMGWRETSKYEMQEHFLKKLCIFRKRTLQRLNYLLHGKQTAALTADSAATGSESPSQRLDRYIKEADRKSYQMVEPLSKEQKKEFESRLRIIMEQAHTCERKA